MPDHIHVELRGLGRVAAAMTIMACAACGITVVTDTSRSPGPPTTSPVTDKPAKVSPRTPTTGPSKPAVKKSPATESDERPAADAPPDVLANAEAELESGRIDAAIAVLQSVPASDRATTTQGRLLRDAYNRRALIHYGADRIDDAINDMVRSLEIDPDQPDIRAQLARASERLDRIKTLQ